MKLYRQMVGIPMGTNCAPLVANVSHFYNKPNMHFSSFNSGQYNMQSYVFSFNFKQVETTILFNYSIT